MKSSLIICTAPELVLNGLIPTEFCMLFFVVVVVVIISGIEQLLA